MEKSYGFLVHVTKDSIAMVRVIAGATILFAVVILGLYVVGKFVLPTIIDQFRGARVSVKDGVISIAKKDGEIRVLSLPASSGWMDTGVTIEPGKEVNMTVSGSVHLAAHHLVSNAVAHSVSNNTWSGPRGRAFFEQDNCSGLKRKELLLYNNLPNGSEQAPTIGQVLAYLACGNGNSPLNFERPGGQKKQIDPRQLIDFSTFPETSNRQITRIPNPCTVDAKLYVIINDFVFDNNVTKSQFMGPLAETLDEDPKKCKSKFKDKIEYRVSNHTSTLKDHEETLKKDKMVFNMYISELAKNNKNCKIEMDKTIELDRSWQEFCLKVQPKKDGTPVEVAHQPQLGGLFYQDNMGALNITIDTAP